MYLEHFGLTHKAFSNTPDARFVFLNEQYEETLSRLLYVVEEREMALLVGEIGTGKSLMIRALADRLPESCDLAVVVNPRLPPVQFLATVADELGVEKPAHRKSVLFVQIQERLLALDEKGRTAVLIVDEAQLVPSKAVFDEIRLLTNFQLDDRNLLAVLLVGQPELVSRLRHAAYRPLTQRFTMTCELTPLSEADTHRYIKHRLKRAGGNGKSLFAQAALATIHQRSRGVPRVINKLSTHSLIEAFARGARRVDRDIVEAVTQSMLFL